MANLELVQPATCSTPRHIDQETASPCLREAANKAEAEPRETMGRWGNGFRKLQK